MTFQTSFTAIIKSIMAKILFTDSGLRFLCMNMVPKVAPTIPADEAMINKRQSTLPIAQQVKNPAKDENGTTKAVITVIFLGLKPNININGEIIPPPPTPSKPDKSPAKAPINDNEK